MLDYSNKLFRCYFFGYFYTMHSLVEENYLKALYLLSLDNSGEVSVNDLSKHLDIKMPTVTSMMKKLAKKDLVDYESYKPLRLSDNGKREAALIIRKHRLTEMYLVERMGFGWEEVHDIAEQIEHIQSPEFFAKMDALLGHPKIDPHGSPIPDKNGRMIWRDYIKLCDCRIGEEVKVTAVINTTDDFLKFLNGKEIALGLHLKIESIEPFDHSMVVSYEGHEAETLSKLITERLLVEN